MRIDTTLMPDSSFLCSQQERRAEIVRQNKKAALDRQDGNLADALQPAVLPVENETASSG